MHERTTEQQAEAVPELADLELPDESAEQVKGGSEPVNDRKSPYA